MNKKTGIISLLLTILLVLGQGGGIVFAVEGATGTEGAPAVGVIAGSPQASGDVNAADTPGNAEGASTSDPSSTTGTTGTADNPADPSDPATDPASDVTGADDPDATDPDATDPANPDGPDATDPDNAEDPEAEDAEDPEDPGFSLMMDELDVSLDGVYTIASALPTNKVIDIPGASMDNGVKLQTYVANRTPAQRFQIKPISDDPGFYTIINIQSGKVFDVPQAQAKSQAPIQQYKSNGTDAQKWAFVSTGEADGSYYLIPKLDSKLCLDVMWASTESGARLQLYTSNGTAAQRFLLQKQGPSIANGLYTIQSRVGSSFVLDVAGGSLLDRANAQIYRGNSTFAQKFNVAFDANTGYYTITGSMSRKALDVAGGSSASGANVIFYQPNQTKAQMWAIESDGKGAYVLYSACGGKALDVDKASAKSGANVQVYTPNDTAAQSWDFFSVGLLNDGIYLVTSALGTVLDTSADKVEAGTNVKASTAASTLAQRFSIQQREEGSYTIECLNSGLLVAGIASTGNVQLESGDVDDSRLWQPVTTGDGHINLKNKATGKVLDVKGGSPASGTNVQLATAGTALSQKWSLVSVDPLPDGYYTIVSIQDTNLVVDIPSASRANGTRPQLYSNNDTAAQRFNATVSASGSYTIAAMCSFKNLDVLNATIDSSGNGVLQQYSPNATNAQKWRIEYVGDGQFAIFSLLKDAACITVRGSAAAGAPLAISTYSHAANQRFIFRPVSGTVYVPHNITLDQMAGYQKAGNPYLANVSLAEIRNALDPSQISGTARYQFADLRAYSGLSAKQINDYLSSTALGRSGILKEHGAAFVKASQQYGINECFLVAHAINETGWGTSELAKGYYYDGKTAIEGTYYPAGTYYNFFGIGAFDSSPLAGGRSMAIQNGWDTPEKGILGGAEWIGKFYIYASTYPQPTVYDMKWDVARSAVTHQYGWHQYATDHLWPTKNSRLMNECYTFSGFTPNLHYLIPAYASPE